MSNKLQHMAYTSLTFLDQLQDALKSNSKDQFCFVVTRGIKVFGRVEMTRLLKKELPATLSSELKATLRLMML